MSVRRAAVWFLMAQAVGATLWWCALLIWPETRALFLAKGAPDSTLLAFGVADGILFIGVAGASDYGFWAGRRWAWPALCIHAGAAGYAAIYCWTLVGLTGGDGLLGDVLMSPSLVVPEILIWRLRPEGGGP